MINKIASLTSGTLISQLILLLIYPILAYFYSPNEIGEVSLILSVLALCSIISSARYDVAIPLPRSRSEFIKVTIISIVILLAFSFSFALILILLTLLKIDLLFVNFQEESYIILFLPVAIIAQGLLNILVQIATRFSYFNLIAKSKVLQSSVTSFFQIALFKLGSFGLLLSQIISQIIISVIFKRKLRLRLSKRIFFKKIDLNVIKKYRDIPKYSIASGLLGAIGQQSPLLIIGYYYGAAFAGLYAIAVKLILTPVAALSASIGSVLYSSASKQYSHGILSYVLKNTSLLIAKAAIPLFLLLYYVIEDVLNLIFKNNWSDVGKFAEIILPWICMMLIVSPFQSYFLVLRREREMMFFQAIFLSLRALSLILGAYFGGAIQAVFTFSITSAVIWTFVLMNLYVRTGVLLYEIVKSMRSTAFMCGVIIISFNYISGMSSSFILDYIFAVSFVLVSFVVYFIYFVFPHVKIVKEIA